MHFSPNDIYLNFFITNYIQVYATALYVHTSKLRVFLVILNAHGKILNYTTVRVHSEFQWSRVVNHFNKLSSFTVQYLQIL